MLPPDNINALRFWLNLFITRNRHRLGVGAMLAVATALSGIALLALSGWFITATALAGSAIALGLVYALDIYLPGGGIRFFALSRTVSRYFERLYNHDTVLGQLARSRVALFSGLQQLSRSQSRTSSDSDWLNRLTAELDTLDNLYLRLLLPPMVTLLSTIVFFAILALWLPWFSLATAAWLSLALLLSFVLFLRQNISQGAALAGLFLAARADVIQLHEGIAELSASKSLLRYQHRLIASNSAIQQQEQQLQHHKARLQLMLNSLQSAVFVLLMFMLLNAFTTTAVSAPVAVLFILGWLGVAELISSLPAQLGVFGKTVFSAARLAQLAQMPDTTSRKAQQSQITTVQLNVTAHPHIACSAQQTVGLVLNANNAKLLVTGESGCGKSTLATCLAAEQSHPGVEIQLNGHALDTADWPRYQQQVAYLTQANSIFADTLRYNLQLGQETLPEQALWQALAAVELEQWARALPQGLDTWLGDWGQNLSGGQARRLSLARLLLRQADLVILDEPFNGLDAEMANRVWHNIQPWLENKLVFISLHEKQEQLVNINRYYHLPLTVQADTNT
ncbi:MAG: ATP-binding cassette domain-containing protein [Gammaproteobacteria bacterium]|nr:ATP-binding cassette domain-containing protein [Gammaproteobacteria bacterium]